MGLSERREVKAFQDDKLSQLKKDIDSAAGFKVEIEVKWEGLEKEGMSHLYADGFTKVYFTPVQKAFKEICADTMGKDSLKKALKKVVLCNESDKYGKDAISFSGGILKIDHDPITNMDDVEERAQTIVKLVSDAI